MISTLSTLHLLLFSAVSFRVRRSYLLLTEQSQGWQRCKQKTTGRSGNLTLKTDSVVNSEQARMCKKYCTIHGELWFMWWYIQKRCHASLVLYFQKGWSFIMASDHYMAVGVDQYIIDQDDEDCPEIGLHLAAWKGDAVQLEELLTCHKDHVRVKRQRST